MIMAPDGAARLFAFPHVGAGCAQFAELARSGEIEQVNRILRDLGSRRISLAGIVN